ncbi:MAG: hypothetical protein COX48_05665 [bacterium (Candidatus Stahlbacteria) CG23_combo_of_CG06-09_8_20_14_all_34_7]|nr:MAG: hypothetical protein COX48_05665 [bacterium (Candidatus Stahlbacteria) CG23_combo_of_CG06-09_8_20_14_all_34_7]
MYQINYILIFGAILSLFFSSYIFFRKDIDFRKISVVQILLIIFLTELSFFIVTETIGYDRGKLWFFVFMSLFIFSQYFMFFYFFESYYKNNYIKILYPLFIFILTIFIFLLFIGRVETMYDNLKFTLSSGINFAIINCIIVSLIFIWIVLIILSIIMRRWFFTLLGILFLLNYISSIYVPTHLRLLTFTLHSAVIIFSPFAIIADFLMHNKYPFYQQYDSESIINAFPFGILLVLKNDKISVNKFLMTLLSNEIVSPNIWFREHKKELYSLNYDSFSSLELSIGRREYHLYIERIKVTNMLYKTDLFIIFNYTNIQVLEKMSKEYTNFVVTSLMDKIYQYNVQIQYNQMFEFLRGFAHNAFSMISVIKAGFEYLIDGIESFETILFTTKNMTKMKEHLIEKFNLMEKTLNLTDVGVAKLMDSFRILNNKIRFEFLEESTNFNINSFIEQELFFYITNTQYKYTINIETRLNEKLRDIFFNYKILSTIFHNILRFIINEMTSSHIKKIIIETYENKENEVVLRIEGSVEDFENRKIDDILYSSVYITDTKYASLINAFLMTKSTGSRLKRIDSKNLVFEFIINE